MVTMVAGLVFRSVLHYPTDSFAIFGRWFLVWLFFVFLPESLTFLFFFSPSVRSVRSSFQRDDLVETVQVHVRQRRGSILYRNLLFSRLLLPKLFFVFVVHAMRRSSESLFRECY